MDRSRATPQGAAAQTQPDGEMAAFTSSLKKALEKNRALQKHIVETLQSLCDEMADNRHLASRLTRELHLEADGERSQREYPEADLEAVAELYDKMADGEDESAQADSEDPVKRKEHAERQKLLSEARLKQLWSVDVYKNFKRQFFVDSSNSTPKPNADILKRRSIEEEQSKDPHKFLPHLSPPWNSHEKKLLTDSLHKKPSDYMAAARYVTAKRKPDPDLPLRQPRSSTECKIQHERLKMEKQPKLTKAETQKIVQQVQEMQADTGNTGSEEMKVDWEKVAKNVGNDRTPWQCFVAYQKVLYGGPQQPVWTPQQDELLLKYIAAQGPQFVLDNAAVDEMCRKLFPDKSQRQVFLRANTSLVNPNLQGNTWTLPEERKLVLCQRIYKEAPLLVSVHFPNRSSRSVREKWSRNLDPAYYNKAAPFTPEEDEILKKAVAEKLAQNTVGERHNQMGSAISWAEITKAHFPGRRSDAVRTRWIQDLATQEEMLHKLKADMAARQGIGAGGSTTEKLDDYVLQVVNKKTRKRKKK